MTNAQRIAARMIEDRLTDVITDLIATVMRVERRNARMTAEGCETEDDRDTR
jgi:hypothetical protein